MCHSVDGSASVGPTWRDLYMSTVTMADGSQLVADITYLRKAIVDPAAHIVAGYSTSMPTYYGSLFREDDVNDIVAYIISLP